MLRPILRSIRSARAYQQLPERAKAEHNHDLTGQLGEDPGIEKAINAAISWIMRAQDNSASEDGGVARDFSLIDGWNASYPETTGYIIPTILSYSKITNDIKLRQRAKQMLDWLLTIQFEEGGFPGSVVGAEPVVPVTFNTGQILLGLASGTGEFGDEYRGPMRRTADWLAQTQDADGCWRKFASPFADPVDKTYDTHVAWGLFEAARIEPHAGYSDAAEANVKWALNLQRDNGWFEDCCLTDTDAPLTHTIGYALRGVIEAFRFTGDQFYLEKSRLTADALLDTVLEDGSIPGRLDSDWNAAVSWSCLTGCVQIAACWFLLYKSTGQDNYLAAARDVNQFVRRTIRIAGPRDIRGAVKGSLPVSGGYCTYEFPNWATKFFIDSNMMERAILAEGCN